MCIPRLLRVLFAAMTLGGIAQAEELPTSSFNGLSRANGKQIVRLAGDWLVVTPEESGRRSWLSTSAHETSGALAAWRKSAFLSSDGQGLFRSHAASFVPPSLVVDRQGSVHAAWDDGQSVWYAHSKPGAKAADLLDRSSWTGADGGLPQPILSKAQMGDIAMGEANDVWIAAVKRAGDGPTALALGHLGPKGSWQFVDLAQDVGFHPPVLHLAGDGTVHVAWSDTRGRVLYVHHRPGETAELQVICKGGFTPNGRHPSLLVIGRQVLIAFETFYDQIEYAVLEQGKWTTAQRLTSLDERLKTDVLHSPQLALDRHGVPWLFFSDTTRSYSYFTRWLGHSWSDVYDCRGIYYRSPRFETDLLPADWMAVEKHPPAGADEIGIALANALAPEQNEFHAVVVPSPRATSGSSTLFFDLLDAAQIENVELVLDAAQKDPRNPLVKPGKPGSFDQDRVLNHGTVIYDDNRFRMWYGSAHRQRGVGWWKWMGTGYAQSSDGLVWEKPQLNVDPQLDANQLPLPWPCSVFKDAEDENSQQRYKVVQFDRHQRQLTAALEGKYDMDAPTCPGELWQSADGTHWKSEPISISFSDGKPWELVVQSFFIDRREPDPARRWKIYGYATLVARRRAGCFAYSADGRHWTAYPRNPILDPRVSEVPMVPAGPESQIHDTVVFPYSDYYLALFHAQHDARFLDVELAASRDGEHFVHVKHGQKVIPLGTRGSWDWQQILQTPPIAARDRLWLFYGGQAMPAELAARGETNNELLVGGAGLATLRLDGFTHLALGEGQRSGSLTTVPFELSGSKPLSLVVNADCHSNGKLAVEVLDAKTGQLIPGFSRGDCRPLATDNLRSVVAWTGGEQLPSTGRQQVVLRFWFEREDSATGPRLYGFAFR